MTLGNGKDNIVRFKVLPYKQGSRGAKALATALGGRVLKLEGSVWKPKAGDVVINWGSTDTEKSFDPADLVQDPANVREASHKLLFFKRMEEECPSVIPKFWTEKEDIPDEEYPIVCRTILNGHSGAGIVIANTPDDIVPANLYVKYVKKEDEYRVHCGKTGESCANIIDIQRKARRLNYENPNWQIRNHANGFVYVRSDVNPPPCVTEVAYKAFEATGLDFGAVDVIYNAHQNKAYVLEINTAPGLEGQTVISYAEFFKETYG